MGRNLSFHLLYWIEKPHMYPEWLSFAKQDIDEFDTVLNRLH